MCLSGMAMNMIVLEEQEEVVLMMDVVRQVVSRKGELSVMIGETHDLQRPHPVAADRLLPVRDTLRGRRHLEERPQPRQEMTGDLTTDLDRRGDLVEGV